MQWWHWKRAEHALDTWVRALIGARPYTIAFATGKGSFVNFSTPRDRDRARYARLAGCRTPAAAHGGGSG